MIFIYRLFRPFFHYPDGPEGHESDPPPEG